MLRIIISSAFYFPLLQWTAIAIVGFIACTLIQRLIFHPLAHIPGPRLAAASTLYQTYYCFAGGGSRFYQKVKQLHDQYGPVIRITPNEVHLSDPSNYEKIYHVGTPYSKDPLFYGAFGNPNSSFTTPSNEIHRLRRSGLNSFFSRKVVLDLEDIVHEKVEKLSKLVFRALHSGHAVDMHHGLRAVSIDVITDYAFGKSYDLLDQPDLGLKFFTLVHKLGPAAWVFRQWPWLKPIAMIVPKAIMKVLSEPIGQVRDMQTHVHEQLESVRANMERPNHDSTKENERPTIFSALMTPSTRPTKALVDNLEDEAYTVITAAADTTGNAMTTIVRCVVTDSSIYQTLYDELKTAFPEETAPLEYKALERLPYLTRMIKEGLRLSFGVPGRLPRVVPKSGATFNSYALPPGTVVSMSSWLLHQDEEYFPNPTHFDPGRWSDPAETQRLEQAFVPFGKGSRACVGMNLAYCELYVTIATLFRRFPNLMGNELGPEDLIYDDYFSSYIPLSAKKFHVMALQKN